MAKLKYTPEKVSQLYSQMHAQMREGKAFSEAAKSLKVARWTLYRVFSDEQIEALKGLKETVFEEKVNPSIRKKKTKKLTQNNSNMNATTNEMSQIQGMVNNPQTSIGREIITPEIAEAYLKANTENRKLRKSTVKRYAQDMSEGRWKEGTTETIKISPTGRILDGQHRLHAVVESGTKHIFWIAKGVSEEVFDVIDTGAVRNAPDAFMVRGINYSTQIPSMISFYNGVAQGFISSDQNKHKRLTNTQLLQAYEERPEFWQATAKKTQRWYINMAKLLSGSMIGGLYAYFYDKDADDSEEFFEQLSSGLNIQCNSIALLRNKLMVDKMNTAKLPVSRRTALIIKSWNHFRAGHNDASFLKFDPAREAFPEAA